MPVRVFTLSEANEMLPQIEEHILWFQETVRQIVQKQDSAAVLEVIGGEDETRPETKELVKVRNDLDRLVQGYNDRLEEFQALGCLIKNINIGLVDFYGLKNGRLIFFCWKLHEKTIEHWHEISSGFVGRRPVAEL